MNKFKEHDSPVLEYTALAAVVFVIIAGVFYFKDYDVNLCRRLFGDLANARLSAARRIDWDNLKALGTDVGATYVKLTTPKAKKVFQKVFIERFALGFMQGGGKPSFFTNWRVYQKNSEQIIVSADYAKYKRTLLFVLKRHGGVKLIFLQWK